MINKKTYPEDKAQVLFTDLQGIQRKGTYRRDLGFQESTDSELPTEGKSFFPDEDITSWAYENDNGAAE